MNSKLEKKRESKHTGLKSLLTTDNLIFILFLSFIILYFGFQTYYLQTDSPQVAVTTTSMVPTYNGFDLISDPLYSGFDVFRGDLLIVQNKPAEVGDTIVFQLPSQKVAIVHRVIAEKIENSTRYFATKGDNNAYSDISIPGNNFGWINEKFVKGVIIFSIHNVGWFSLELQNSGLRLLLLLAMGVIIALGAIEYFSNDKKREEEPLESNKPQNRRKIFIKWQDFRFQIYRPKLFVFFLIFSLLATILSFGTLHYFSGSNSVELYKNNQTSLESINLSGFEVENYRDTSVGLFLYNFKMKISSHGVFNTVSRVEISVAYDNFQTIKNPSFIWTIVYDFAGTKEIKSVLLLKDLGSNQVVLATIHVKLFSSGLLAQPVQEFSQPLSITFPA